MIKNKLKFEAVTGSVAMLEKATADDVTYTVFRGAFNNWHAMVASNPAKHVSDSKLNYPDAKAAKKACDDHFTKMTTAKEAHASTVMGVELMEVYEKAAKASGVTVESLQARFGQRNPGMQRMQLNMILKRVEKASAK